MVGHQTRQREDKGNTPRAAHSLNITKEVPMLIAGYAAHPANGL